MAGLFDSFESFAQQATPAGWVGFYDDTSIDYNDMFAQQLTLYREELNRKNKKFESNEALNSNLASTTILTGGSKPVGAGSGGMGVNFGGLQQEFDKLLAETSLDLARSGENLNGLSGDQLERQKQANAKRLTMVS